MNDSVNAYVITAGRQSRKLAMVGGPEVGSKIMVPRTSMEPFYIRLMTTWSILMNLIMQMELLCERTVPTLERLVSRYILIFC